MSYELIPEEVYANLPEDRNEKFAALVAVAQASLVRLLDEPDHEYGSEFAEEVRGQFMSVLSALAEELGIHGLRQPASGSYEEYRNFQAALAAVVARARLQSPSLDRPFSVKLGTVTAARIRQEVDQLRHAIEGSDLPRAKKEAVLRKLEELLEELDKQRLGFARTMAIAASIATILGGTTTTIASAPKAGHAILRIIQWIGQDKVKEEQERARLAPPVLRITKQAHTQQHDSDGDVPF